jgi:hypothetical protein
MWWQAAQYNLAGLRLKIHDAYQGRSRPMMQVLKMKKTRLTPLFLSQAQVRNETERLNAKVRHEDWNKVMRTREEMII